MAEFPVGDGQYRRPHRPDARGLRRGGDAGKNGTEDRQHQK